MRYLIHAPNNVRMVVDGSPHDALLAACAFVYTGYVERGALLEQLKRDETVAMVHGERQVTIVPTTTPLDELIAYRHECVALAHGALHADDARRRFERAVVAAMRLNDAGAAALELLNTVVMAQQCRGDDEAQGAIERRNKAAKVFDNALSAVGIR